MLRWSLLTSLVLVGIFHIWKVNFPSLEKVLSYKGAIGFGRCLPLLTFGVGASLGMSSPKLRLAKAQRCLMMNLIWR